MEKAKKIGIIAALILLGLVAQLLLNRAQEKGETFNDTADKIELRLACSKGDAKACQKVKDIEKTDP